jgi:hypothetical protein
MPFKNMKNRVTRFVVPEIENILNFPNSRRNLETSTTFRGTSIKIQNYIIRAASDVVLEKIKSEIRNSIIG